MIDAVKGRPRMKQRKEGKVSSTDVQAAIRKFMEEGGIITKLPEEKAAEGRMVGRKWNTSEMAGESN